MPRNKKKLNRKGIKPMKKTLKDVKMGWIATTAIVAYAIIAIATDLFANKMLNIGGLTLAGGILLIPFSFTIRDLIHKLIGFDNVKKVVWTTAIVNLGVAALLILLDVLPSAIPGQQEAWHALMGASWRVIIASFIAQLVSDLGNTYVYQWVWNKLGNKHVWVRTVVSNLPACFLDSALFSYIAFLGVLDPGIIWASVLSSFAVKYVLSLVATPLTYLSEGKKEDK